MTAANTIGPPLDGKTRRRNLTRSWFLGAGGGFDGTDGARLYRVQLSRFKQHGAAPRWCVVIDGVPLRSLSQRVLRVFNSAEQACWAAELEALREEAGK